VDLVDRCRAAVDAGEAVSREAALGPAGAVR
jgi:hypothetical protein